ncbi:hypothetical protein KEM55_000037 [Ascosphaera atra]|nr:hypothetical protein KEM55_000037 [Ascosphaera atra]
MLELLATIETILRTSFSQKPPHTLQRFAELLQSPNTHYKTLPAYLRAVERVVSVATSADIFPLPLARPLDGAMRGTINGYGGSMLSDDAGLGEGVLDGAALTPIPWLSNTSLLEAEAADAIESEEEPHARGPALVGVEDLGPQSGSGVELPISTSENAAPDIAKDEEEAASSDSERDADGDIDMSVSPAIGPVQEPAQATSEKESKDG